MKKILVIYSTCGLSGRQNHNYYTYDLSTMLSQQFNSFDVVVSDCLCSSLTRQILFDRFKNRCHFNLINSKLPINITVNQSILTAVKNLGEYESYLSMDSGVNFHDDPLVLQKLYDLYKSGPYGIVQGRTRNDTGFDHSLYLPFQENDYLSYREWFNKNGHYVVPVGAACCNHVMLFGQEMFNYYGRLLPDIFAGQYTETVQTFMVAALKLQWIIHKDIEVDHFTNLDIPSVGFSPNQFEAQGGKKWDHLVNCKESILDIIGRGVEYGMGYGETNKIVMHNPDKFDRNSFAKDARLAPYIKENIFLRKEQFNYDEIQSEWI